MAEFCRKFAWGAMAVFAAAAPACRSTPSAPGSDWTRFESRSVAMGVVCRIVLFARDSETASAGLRAARASIEEDELRFSDYRSQSELVRIEEAAGRGWVEASDAFCDLAAAALEISRASGGAFDATIGPLTRLWRRARDEGRPADPAAEAEARARIGWTGLTVDRASGRVALARAGMQLDFGGIAKGYACARAVQRLRGLGLSRCMVALAGDVALGDPPPGAVAWRIAVAPDGGEIDGILTASNVCISTSSDTAQSLDFGTGAVPHLLDARRGLSPGTRTPATVIAGDGAVADGLATALAIAGPARAPEILAHFPGASARLGRGRDAVAFAGFPPLETNPARADNAAAGARGTAPGPALPADPLPLSIPENP